jgi:predicted permease
VAAVSGFAARFSVRALEVTVDGSVLGMGAALAMAAAVLLAYVPRLPSQGPASLVPASSSLRITPATRRRLRLFATTQIAFSFVLLAGAATLVAALVALQAAKTGYDTRQILALDVPWMSLESTPNADFYQEATRRIAALPEVDGVAVGNFVPWRDVGTWPRFQFGVEGYTPADGEDNPHARPRFVGPGFFATLGIPLVAGRDFTEADRDDSEPVVIVSQSIAQRLFLNADAVGRTLSLTSRRRPEASGTPVPSRRRASSPRPSPSATPVPSGAPRPSRIIGVVADVDDEGVVQAPAMTLYYPFAQAGMVSRLFVRTSGDPYALVPALTRIIRELSPERPVERAATLADVRAEVLTPERLNAFVVSGFAGIALLIAAVGVAGVLAFSVSARTREFGVRLAVGSSPRHLLLRVLGEGTGIVAIGIGAGAAGGYAFTGLAASYLGSLHLPGAVPLLSAATVLAAAAVLASLLPAARASRVDVLQALRSE